MCVFIVCVFVYCLFGYFCIFTVYLYHLPLLYLFFLSEYLHHKYCRSRLCTVERNFEMEIKEPQHSLLSGQPTNARTGLYVALKGKQGTQLGS